MPVTMSHHTEARTRVFPTQSRGETSCAPKGLSAAPLGRGASPRTFHPTPPTESGRGSSGILIGMGGAVGGMLPGFLLGSFWPAARRRKGKGEGEGHSDTSGAPGHLALIPESDTPRTGTGAAPGVSGAHGEHSGSGPGPERGSTRPETRADGPTERGEGVRGGPGAARRLTLGDGAPGGCPGGSCRGPRGGRGAGAWRGAAFAVVRPRAVGRPLSGTKIDCHEKELPEIIKEKELHQLGKEKTQEQTGHLSKQVRKIITENFILVSLLLILNFTVCHCLAQGQLLD